MITIIGACLWLLAGASALRLILIGNRAGRSRWLEPALLALLALPVFFRPHEDIFGGEDPGSYVNSGITYNRHGELFYVDDLLAKIPPEARSNFYYGHAGYGLTKDACLWIRNESLAMVGPHFQPAYPLMIAFADRIGGASWALYVVPFFAILTALALRALAALVLPCRWAGTIAFIVFACAPIAVWHGRCARPEIIAAFLFFGGCAMSYNAWLGGPRKKPLDLVLGGACIGLAPLFHVTAWMLAIPAAAVAATIVIARGRRDFLAHLAAMGLMFAVFYGETKYVTDYYTAKRFFDTIIYRPLPALGALSIFVLAALWQARRQRGRPSPAAAGAAGVSAMLSALLAAGVLAFVASIVFFRPIYGDLPILGRPVMHYLYLTDFKVVAAMISVPIALLSAAGAAAWLVGPAENRAGRIVIFCVIFPAIMLTGNINDFMSTRYLMVAFVPASALFISALLCLLPRSRSLSMLPLALCALICAAGLRDRLHLVTTVEHSGFCSFLRPFAEIIRANRGMLLCEYSRIAAPLEHFFGIPTLGLDNERRQDYTAAEKAWVAVMLSDTNRPAYFATPFHAPASPRFDFELVYRSSFPGCRLEQARRSLPTRIGRATLNLNLYRMTLKGRDTKATASPFAMQLDAGNMGLRNFANTRSETITLEALDLPANKRFELPPPGLDYGELLLFFLGPDSSSRPIALTASIGERDSGGALMPIGGGWHVIRLSLPAGQASGSLALEPSAPMSLAEAYAVTDGKLTRLGDAIRPVSARTIPVAARWTRAAAHVYLEPPKDAPALLLILMTAPDPAGTGSITLELGWKGAKLGEPRKIRSGQWGWHAWRLPPSGDGGWLDLCADPAWNPGLRNFPPDLGVLISQIVLLPVD